MIVQPSSSSSSPRIPRMSRLFVVVVVALLFVLGVEAAAAAAVAAAGSSAFDRSISSIVEPLIDDSEDDNVDESDDRDVLILPLLSHSFVQERYRRERRQRRKLADGRDLWWSNQQQQQQQQQQQDETSVQSKKSHTQDIWIPSESDIDPLYQGFGTHYVDLWVGCGESPQRQTLVVDTGSSLTAFPCAKECIVTRQSDENGKLVDVNECDPYNRHVGTPYLEEESSCFRYVTCQAHHECTTLPSPATNNACSNNETTPASTTENSAGGGQCRISAAYLEGSSWSAVEVMDRVYTGGSHESPTTAVGADVEENTFDLRFACQTSVTGLFQIQLSDGIMGMDRTHRSYWNQYFDSKQSQNRQFALCLAKNPALDPSGSGAGAMILGGTDPRMHKTPMAYAQLENDKQYFIVWLEKMYLRRNGGHSIVPHNAQDESDNEIAYETLDILPMELNRGSLIIDSGTTATFFSKSLWEPFQQAYRRLTGTDFDTSERKMTTQELNDMPTILLQLSPAKLNGKNKKHHHHKKKDIKHQSPGVVAGSLDPDNAESILVALPPHRYMRYIEKRGTYAPEMQFSEAGARHQVLGAYFLDGKMVHFDVTRRRVGFAESDCNYATGTANGRYGNETAYPAFQNHPPPLHSYDEDEAEEYVAWYSPFEDSEDSESSSSSSGTHEGNSKMRLATTVLVFVLIAICVLAACVLRLIRRGRELRQFQRRQRRGEDSKSSTQGGKASSARREQRQHRNNTSSRIQKKKKNKRREKQLQQEEEELNLYNADDLERMAMLDFPTLGENDDGLMFDRFRDEPSDRANDIELSARR